MKPGLYEPCTIHHTPIYPYTPYIPYNHITIHPHTHTIHPGLFLSETFYDDKYEDDSERKGLEGMLECMESKETPRVPFNPRDLRLVDDDNEPGISYENAIYSLMSKVSDVEDRLSLIPEEEPDFRVGEAKAPEVPRLRLVEVMPEYEEGLEPEEGVPDPHMIQLYSGVQMMGRGQGGVESKAVSR